MRSPDVYIKEIKIASFKPSLANSNAYKINFVYGGPSNTGAVSLHPRQKRELFNLQIKDECILAYVDNNGKETNLPNVR